MSQGLGVYGRDRGGDMWRVWGHMAGCGGMWQGVGSYARVWGHVVGCGGMSQGTGAYGRDICQMSKSQRC